MDILKETELNDPIRTGLNDASEDELLDDRSSSEFLLSLLKKKYKVI